MTGVILSTQVDLQKESQAMLGGESQHFICAWLLLKTNSK